MTPTDTRPLLGEDAIVQTFLAPLAQGLPGAFGLRDDCAALSIPPGCELVIKTDPVRAGVHFLVDDRPEDIAWKALAVNVSDLAAKGAEPLAYTLALSFPERPTRDWMQRFARGLAEAQAAFGCQLCGGDTDHAPGPLSIAVPAFGVIPTGRMIRRGTAQPSDCILVSGTIGDAALGLAVRQSAAEIASWPIDGPTRDQLRQRYLRPNPRLVLRDLLRRYATAAMDVSDGLIKDLDRLCRASHVGAQADLMAVPLSVAARAIAGADDAIQRRLVTHGDDYEILCTMPKTAVVAAQGLARMAGIPLTVIGHIQAGHDVAWRDANGSLIIWDRPGYDHF